MLKSEEEERAGREGLITLGSENAVGAEMMRDREAHDSTARSSHGMLRSRAAHATSLSPSSTQLSGSKRRQSDHPRGMMPVLFVNATEGNVHMPCCAAGPRAYERQLASGALPARLCCPLVAPPLQCTEKSSAPPGACPHSPVQGQGPLRNPSC